MKNETDIGTIEASDTDTLIYSLGGVDSTFFTIGSTSGALSFNVAPDYDMAGDADGDNVYEFTITVDDGQSASNSIIFQSIQVMVNNINETPVINSTTSPQLIFDENTDGVVVSIMASDEDTAIIYSIDRSDFTIDDLGVLRLQDGGFNYERLSGMDGTATIEVIVTISDGQVGTNDLSESFTVTINDIDIEAPLTRTDFSIVEKPS